MRKETWRLPGHANPNAAGVAVVSLRVAIIVVDGEGIATFGLAADITEVRETLKGPRVGDKGLYQTLVPLLLGERLSVAVFLEPFAGPFYGHIGLLPE